MVGIAQLILEKRFELVWSIQRARKMVEGALSQMQDGIVLLERFARAGGECAQVPVPGGLGGPFGQRAEGVVRYPGAAVLP